VKARISNEAAIAFNKCAALPGSLQNSLQKRSREAKAGADTTQRAKSKVWPGATQARMTHNEDDSCGTMGLHRFRDPGC